MASAAVLAIFVGGLGAGGILLGPRADRDPWPPRDAQLEAIVALSAQPRRGFLRSSGCDVAAGGTTRLGIVVGTLAVYPRRLSGGADNRDGWHTASRGRTPDIDALMPTAALTASTRVPPMPHRHVCALNYFRHTRHDLARRGITPHALQAWRIDRARRRWQSARSPGRSGSEMTPASRSSRRRTAHLAGRAVGARSVHARRYRTHSC